MLPQHDTVRSQVMQKHEHAARSDGTKAGTIAARAWSAKKNGKKVVQRSYKTALVF